MYIKVLIISVFGPVFNECYPVKNIYAIFPLTQTDMQNQGEKARELFCQVVRTFIQNYGLQSDGHDRRKEEQKQALVEARLTEDDLKTGILFLLSLYFHSLPWIDRNSLCN